jgi:hypothetical protein
VGLLRFQIADVLADENLVADRQGNGVFQMRADGQNWILGGGHEALFFPVLTGLDVAIEWAAARSRGRGAKPVRGPASRAQSNRPRAGQWGGCGREKHRRCRRAVPSASRSSVQIGSSLRLPLVATTGKPSSAISK